MDEVIFLISESFLVRRIFLLISWRWLTFVFRILYTDQVLIFCPVVLFWSYASESITYQSYINMHKFLLRKLDCKVLKNLIATFFLNFHLFVFLLSFIILLFIYRYVPMILLKIQSSCPSSTIAYIVIINYTCFVFSSLILIHSTLVSFYFIFKKY